MARLTRQESRARTREHLLASATEHFLARGYAAASLEQIAEESGYSKGAVYSNFHGKDELCFAVLDRIRLVRVEEITSALHDGQSFDESLAVFQGWADRTVGEPRWTLLEIEFSLRSRRDDVIRERISAGAHQVRGLIAGIVQSVARRHDRAPAMAPDAAATLLLSVGIGLGLQRAITPGLPVDPLIDAIRWVLPPARPRPRR